MPGRITHRGIGESFADHGVDGSFECCWPHCASPLWCGAGGLPVLRRKVDRRRGHCVASSPPDQRGCHRPNSFVLVRSFQFVSAECRHEVDFEATVASVRKPSAIDGDGGHLPFGGQGHRTLPATTRPTRSKRHALQSQQKSVRGHCWARYVLRRFEKQFVVPGDERPCTVQRGGFQHQESNTVAAHQRLNRR